MAAVKRAFAVVVDSSWYQDYIPLYTYFANRACPDAQVFIFVRGELRQNIKDNVKLLGARCKITEGFGEGYPATANTTKALRWTLKSHHIDSADELYIGDIDILLAREHTSLFYQHRAHADFLGVPFSNVVRPGAQRFSGLHFIVSCPYMLATAKATKTLETFIASPDNVTTKNEPLLYKLIEDSGLLTKKLFWLDSGTPPETVRFRPFHGVHLGVFRSGISYAFWDLVDIQYFTDLVFAFRENPALDMVVANSNETIRKLVERALRFGEKICQIPSR